MDIPAPAQMKDIQGFLSWLDEENAKGVHYEDEERIRIILKAKLTHLQAQRS